MIFKRILVVLALAFAGLAPAAAQFADQATWAGTGAGSANAQTITVANASSYSDLLGVLIKFVPGATNGSGGMTLGVTGLAGGAPSVRRPTTTGPSTAMIGNEFVTGQPVVVMYDSAGFFDLISVPNTTTSVGSSNLLNSSLQFGVPVNLQLNATVSSNNLTIAIKGNNGSDPSATNPVLIPFRDSTIANGDPNIVSLQGALSFTINSSNTMGCISAQMCRLWVFAICSSGLECTDSAGSDVVGLCAYNAASLTIAGGVVTAGSVIGINEANLQTSASGTSGGSAAQTIYCNISAVTARAVRYLGYIDIQETTAGTWASGPTYVQLFGPGIHKPGETVNGPLFTGSQSATQSLAIVPTSAANFVKFSFTAEISLTSASSVLAYKRGSTTLWTGTVGGSGIQAHFSDSGAILDAPATTSSTTYSITNSNGAVERETIMLEEIMGDLPEPANDNGSVERRMVG